MTISGARDNCSGLLLPPVDHARNTSSCLAPTGGAAQAAPSCRFLGRDSDQASGHCPECLAVAAAEQVCSQGSKVNNRWCSITMSFSVVPSEVVGAASDFCSGIPSGGGPHPPLEPLILQWFAPATSSLPRKNPPSHLAHVGGATPTAPSCRVFRRGSDQESGRHPEHFGVAAAGWVCSQWHERNNVWCLVAVPSFSFFCQPLR